MTWMHQKSIKIRTKININALNTKCMKVQPVKKEKQSNPTKLSFSNHVDQT